VERTPVVSSHIASIGYSSQEQTLEVEFNDGAVYQYFGVPDVIYEEFLHASSHGRFFHNFIRDAYPYSRM